jgi:hypothetical protein
VPNMGLVVDRGVWWPKTRALQQLPMQEPSNNAPLQLLSVFYERRRIDLTRHVLITVVAAFLAAAAEGVDRANIVAVDVRPILASGDRTDPALLLVYVTDHLGNPLEGIQVSLTERSRSRGTSTTTREGTALLRLSATGHLTVRASHVGFVTAEARRVYVQAGRFTAVALPLEVAVVEDPLTAK